MGHTVLIREIQVAVRGSVLIERRVVATSLDCKYPVMDDFVL